MIRTDGVEIVHDGRVLDMLDRGVRHVPRCSGRQEMCSACSRMSTPALS
jgi:hypothetical protein